LYIGGAGVFSGYYGRDDLSKKALIDIRGQRCYKTGDLARLDQDGQLHFCGRADFQVKLRGQRIEIGEIEQTIMNSSANVSNCIVVKCYNDEQQQEYLVAYVQSCTASLTIEEQIRKHCQSSLPSHMIPSMFILMDKFPLNSNGKIDRKQLPKPDFTQNECQIEINGCPQTDFERQIHDIWCE
ncbi:unnamed protein product, partial [Didymodactylos carnosus]